MTPVERRKQQQIRRLIELGRIAKQRHLEAGGSIDASVGTLNHNDTLTDIERKEYLELANQIFDQEFMRDYQAQNNSSNKVKNSQK